VLVSINTLCADTTHAVRVMDIMFLSFFCLTALCGLGIRKQIIDLQDDTIKSQDEIIESLQKSLRLARKGSDD